MKPYSLFFPKNIEDVASPDISPPGQPSVGDEYLLAPLERGLYFPVYCSSHHSFVSGAKCQLAFVIVLSIFSYSRENIFYQ